MNLAQTELKIDLQRLRQQMIEAARGAIGANSNLSDEQFSLLSILALGRIVAALYPQFDEANAQQEITQELKRHLPRSAETVGAIQDAMNRALAESGIDIEPHRDAGKDPHCDLQMLYGHMTGAALNARISPSQTRRIRYDLPVTEAEKTARILTELAMVGLIQAADDKLDCRGMYRELWLDFPKGQNPHTAGYLYDRIISEMNGVLFDIGLRTAGKNLAT